MRRLFATGVLVSLIAVAIALQAAEPRQPVVAASVKGMTEWDHQNLERNLRWMLSRERRPATEPAQVAVYADAGVWHVGARSIVEALERDGIRCRVIDRSQLRAEVLSSHRALILPGGWAPFQRDAAEPQGLTAIKNYVEQGGRCLAICAGAYLISREAKYESQSYPYPLGLFDGTAEGPLPGLAQFPKPGSVTLTSTAAGQQRGLQFIDHHTIYYSGGPRFIGGTNVEVLARYPDGTAAAIARPLGKGDVLLLGAHFERPPPTTGNDDAPAPDIATKLLRTLLLPNAR